MGDRRDNADCFGGRYSGLSGGSAANEGERGRVLGGDSPNGGVPCVQEVVGRMWEASEALRGPVRVLERRMGQTGRAIEMSVDMGENVIQREVDVRRGSPAISSCRWVVRRKG